MTHSPGKEPGIFQVKRTTEFEVGGAVSLDSVVFEALRQLGHDFLPISGSLPTLLLLDDDLAPDEPVGKDVGGVDGAGGVGLDRGEDIGDAFLEGHGDDQSAKDSDRMMAGSRSAAVRPARGSSALSRS